MDPIFNQRYIPIDQKSKVQVSEFEIGQKLRCMNWEELFDCFVLYDDRVIDDHIIFPLTLRTLP
jgi:hypothetical protein